VNDDMENHQSVPEQKYTNTNENGQNIQNQNQNIENHMNVESKENVTTQENEVGNNTTLQSNDSKEI